MRNPMHLAAAGALFFTLAVAAQDAGGPFQAKVHGAFRQMVHRADFAAKVPLQSAIESQATEGVGALAGLRGEVTIVDGRFVVSCGSQAQCDQPDREKAALLVTARVDRWLEPVTLTQDLRGPELDAFIEARARDAGLDLSAPFPVRLRGTLIEARMHVVSGPNPRFAGHGSGQALAQQDDIAVDRQDGGEAVGIHAPESWRGIATHPGEPFHFHWVDNRLSRTAHLDSFGAARGSALLLPAPPQR